MLKNFFKSTLIILFSSFVVLTGCGSEVLAQTRTPATGSATQRAAERLTGVQNFVNRIITHLEDVSRRADKMLDNLQRKIIRAKSSGKDVTELDRLMKDSREKMVEIKVQIKELKTMGEVSRTRADFTKVRTAITSIKTDLQEVTKNLAEMISILRGFNASETGVENRTKESTPSSE